jgi:bifunctional non-homologous end joining protein LigD
LPLAIRWRRELPATDDRAGVLHLADKSAPGSTRGLSETYAARLDALPPVPRPFKTLPQTIVARTAHWVEPRLVAEVRYTEWTSDGSLRARCKQLKRNSRK